MKNSIKLCLLILFVFIVSDSLARSFEKLNRGAVAVNQGSKGNYLSWRLLIDDPGDVAFNIIRDGQQLNKEPIAATTDFLDPTGTKASVYQIVPATGQNKLFTSPETRPWPVQYLEIPLEAPEAITFGSRTFPYRPNDASVGDLDGDGDYELVLKWEAISHDNSHSGFTSPVILEGLEFSGESLWRIDLGINIRSGAHYTPFVVYDFDGDGKAEVACKTADGTIDGKGKQIGTDTDYRNDKGYILDGREYLTVFDGIDGGALDTVDYIPQRGDPADWGDVYGNRVDRFLAAAGWLDNEHPSIIMARGYYHGKTSKGRTAIATWDFSKGKLKPRWCFDTASGGLDEYIGQGNHSMYIADVDNDGLDEITYGSCALDHDGKGLYSTGFGHGDAGHLGDLDPQRPGLEFFMPHEETVPGMIPGVDFRDAGSGEVLWSIPVDRHRDIGRGVAGDIYSGSPGAECWSLVDGNLYSCKGEIVGPAPRSCNFLIWWDGDTTRELLDGNWIGKYAPGQRGNVQRIFTAEECTSINGSKADPCLCADLFGDWREEVIWPTRDGKSLRIYTTVIPAESRQITLMHDAVYRMSVVWQNSGYNQPTHTGKALE